jgi:hypothetical protein
MQAAYLRACGVSSSYVWPGRLGAAAVRVDQRVCGPRLMAAPRGDASTISVNEPAASGPRPVRD